MFVFDIKFGTNAGDGTGTIVGDGSIDGFIGSIIVGDGTNAGDGTIAGDGTSIGDGTNTGDGTVAGDGITIGDGTIVGDGTNTGDGTVNDIGNGVGDGVVIINEGGGIERGHNHNVLFIMGISVDCGHVVLLRIVVFAHNHIVKFSNCTNT